MVHARSRAGKIDFFIGLRRTRQRLEPHSLPILPITHRPGCTSFPFRAPGSVQIPKTLTPELLPSPSDELALQRPILGAALPGNTLAPASRGITIPGPRQPQCRTRERTEHPG